LCGSGDMSMTSNVPAGDEEGNGGVVMLSAEGY
jgi:hypothetical protein